MRRKAGTGVFAVVLLMFSIVMFAGSLFYLVYLNPLNINMEQPSNTVKISDVEETRVSLIVENKSLQEAINELKNEGCTFVSVSTPVYLVDPQYLNYNDFKLKALETKIVVISPSDTGIFLLVQNGDIQIIWTPYKG